ncbi:MAG: hypothetical protein H0T04_03635, partial [Chloroflexi bacterium]|nr:hypothetical protein [Chloroflexota bacterium]
MAHWRDQRGQEEARIEELEPVARPARVGTSRSARIPALIVGALLVGVAAVGVSGRTEPPRDPATRLAAATGSPAPAASSGPTPEASSPDASSSREGDLSPAPGRGPAGRGLLRSEPPPEVIPDRDDLRFWLVLLSDGEPLLRADLNASNGFYQSVRIDDSMGDDLRARLFGRLGDDQAVRLTDIPVPRVRQRSLDLPLSLAESFIDAADLGSRDPNGLSSDLHMRIRLEQGAGHPPSTMLVVDVLTTVVINDATDPGAAAEGDTEAEAEAEADYDRALANGATREALRRSSRCARMLDPRIGRSEANLEGCERAIVRAGP